MKRIRETPPGANPPGSLGGAKALKPGEQKDPDEVVMDALIEGIETHLIKTGKRKPAQGPG